MAQDDADRDFYPDARYAANTVHGIRWHDDRTGQEQWSRPVGVQQLLDAGATADDPAAVTIATRVKIGPNKNTGGWSVGISRERLDPVRREFGVLRMLGTRTYQFSVFGLDFVTFPLATNPRGFDLSLVPHSKLDDLAPR